MNLYDRLRSFFQGQPTSTLRNKPGGLAWIKDRGELHGTYGRIVTTVCLSRPGHWLIDPPQEAVARTFLRTTEGRPVLPGDRVLVTAVADAYLEPIRDVGDGEKDESARWLPPVPTDAKAPKGVPA